MKLTLIASTIVLASGVDHCRVDVAGVEVKDHLDEVENFPSLVCLQYKHREAANSFGPGRAVISEISSFATEPLSHLLRHLRD